MSVRPIDYSREGVEVWDEDGGHGGVIPWDDVRFPEGMDGKPDPNFVYLACPYPGCGTVSLHPVSGGADPDEVPRLFMRAYLASPDFDDRTFDQARDRARALSGKMDAGRWRAHFDEDEDDERVPIRGRGPGGAVIERQRPPRIEHHQRRWGEDGRAPNPALPPLVPPSAEPDTP